jgi:hypothetical protein
MGSELVGLQEVRPNWDPAMIARIIEKLTPANSPKLRADFRNLKLAIGGKQVEIAGQVIIKLGHRSNAGVKEEASRIDRSYQEEIPSLDPGKVFVFAGDTEVLRIDAEAKRIDVDIEDKAFIKKVMGLREEFTPRSGESSRKQSKKKSTGPLDMLRMTADTSKRLGITLTISYKGKRIATLGAEARPSLLQLVTKTRAVSINSLTKAIQLML